MLTKSETLNLHRQIQCHLIEIERLFKNPKITIVVRAPQLNDGDVILSSDDLELAIAAIRNLQSRDPAVQPDSDPPELLEDSCLPCERCAGEGTLILIDDELICPACQVEANGA